MLKKIRFLYMAAFAAVVLSACGGKDARMDLVETQEESDQITEISLWTFPVGNWGNQTSVSGLITSFQREHPEIHVNVECLDYNDGDQKIREAIQKGNGPDLVFEGPERLVAEWGEQGLMEDLSDLWESDKAQGIYENIRNACQHSNGEYYVFPVCMTAHCMAINYDLFREAGALQYIDEKNHTWTTEGFVKAIQALTAYGQERSGVIYCKNQSGDQGTRALVNNLYGGNFTDDSHSIYTVDSEENKQALRLLQDLEGIAFQPDMTSADEIAQFCRGELAMAFCWNVSIETIQIVNNPELDFEIFPMTFPVSQGEPRLQGGIWGFGIFDNGDEKRVQAAKTFIRYLTENDRCYKRAVLVSSVWPVRDMQEVYENDLLMEEYSFFSQYMGDYYQVTPGWADAREGWWKMLQKIGAGEDVDTAVEEFSRQANGK
ncbi:MAG: extracellular solute-binding protein [Lachnospiraceae bacterium]|jgi:multiple sugar transport system substrate-binding protein|nr:extracellular solute-binding protein [Lachnospiraceae bacterium]MCI9132913.1 extracellular solute-binding protein [Lachnospiraceae bacterium]